ncbi:hypothetical protein PX554_18000 [Sphingomonas sp. H39-1-10]|uniref:hypothetical protein n=1 Tax=Sphingomonas pollutisoli TaxID=3030829 RepID=UPI0023B8CEE1|nr:hypothetical protein [Sphingomonas pollutisoli]MDF0490032.1 hypothetical protein [Sphingomonas pollutisoli]
MKNVDGLRKKPRPNLSGIAQERIPFGASVLCRDFRVSLAGPELANGTVNDRPRFCRETAYEAGQIVFVQPIEGLGARSLQALADGPIMDARSLYLPAGKLTEAEYRARVAADLTDLSGTPHEER